MEQLKLGPNGALVYCMEFLEANFEWLASKLKTFPKDGYFIFDLPGQVLFQRKLVKSFFETRSGAHTYQG
jgi:hypothetical protein